MDMKTKKLNPNYGQPFKTTSRTKTKKDDVFETGRIKSGKYGSVPSADWRKYIFSMDMKTKKLNPNYGQPFKTTSRTKTKKDVNFFRLGKFPSIKRPFTKIESKNVGGNTFQVVKMEKMNFVKSKLAKLPKSDLKLKQKIRKPIDWTLEKGSEKLTEKIIPSVVLPSVSLTSEKKKKKKKTTETSLSPEIRYYSSQTQTYLENIPDAEGSPRKTKKDLDFGPALIVDSNLGFVLGPKHGIVPKSEFLPKMTEKFEIDIGSKVRSKLDNSFRIRFDEQLKPRQRTRYKIKTKSDLFYRSNFDFSFGVDLDQDRRSLHLYDFFVNQKAKSRPLLGPPVPPRFDIDTPFKSPKPRRKGKTHFKFVVWKDVFTKEGGYMGDILTTSKTPSIFNEKQRKQKRKSTARKSTSKKPKNKKRKRR